MRRGLIDECINPRLAPRLRGGLPEEFIERVCGLGWAGRKDHLLLSEIKGRFEVFVTISKSKRFSTGGGTRAEIARRVP